MGVIRIIAPRGNPFFYGGIAVLGMAGDEVLCRLQQGGEAWLTADGPMELGVGWGHVGTPAARLRFMARPDRTYLLLWRAQGFGAEMDVEEYAPGERDTKEE